MRPMRVIAPLLAALVCANVQAAAGRISCVIDDYSDGKPKSYRVLFDDADKSWVVVNGVRYPYSDEFEVAEISAFDDSVIEWCSTLQRGGNNEPARICYAVNRMTGDFTITHHRTGKVKTGSCSAGRAPEGRKF